MAKLTPLIRMRKHAIEQKQKFLAELYRQAEELKSQKTALQTQLIEERQKVNELGIEMLAYFGPFSKAVNDRIEDIDEAANTLEARIEVARDDMRLAFAELKKLEITQERRDAEEETEINKKETNDLDEMALEIFRRKDQDK